MRNEPAWRAFDQRSAAGARVPRRLPARTVHRDQRVGKGKRTTVSFTFADGRTNRCRPETFLLQPEMSSFFGGFGVLKYINITHITCPAYFGEIGGFGVFGVHTKSPSTRNTKKQFLGFLVVLVGFWGFWWDFNHL